MNDKPTEPATRRRCAYCGETLGVYEPLVAVTTTGPFQTSLVVETHLGHGDHVCYHPACYELAREPRE